MEANKTVVTREIEQNLDQYDTYLDYTWSRELGKRLHPRLEAAFDSLCLAWKEAANTHRLPWLLIAQMEAFVGGFVKEHPPHGLRLIDAVKTRISYELGDTVRHMAKKKINAVLEDIERVTREEYQRYDTSIAPREYWNAIVNSSELCLLICGSQNFSYCGLVFGYEWFVVRCFRALGGDEAFRPSHDRFWRSFKALMGGDPEATYWMDNPVWIAREARNCIAHMGGQAKPELVAKNPDLYISPEGIISVQAPDNRKLFALLKGKVTQLVDEVQAKLASGP